MNFLILTQKHDALKDYDADIMVIQECEQEFVIPGYQVFYRHKYQKGLGVLVKSEEGARPTQRLSTFSIETPDFNILGFGLTTIVPKQIQLLAAMLMRQTQEDFMTTNKPTIIVEFF